MRGRHGRDGVKVNGLTLNGRDTLHPSDSRKGQDGRDVSDVGKVNDLEGISHGFSAMGDMLLCCTEGGDSCWGTRVQHRIAIVESM